MAPNTLMFTKDTSSPQTKTWFTPNKKLTSICHPNSVKKCKCSLNWCKNASVTVLCSFLVGFLWLVLYLSSNPNQPQTDLRLLVKVQYRNKTEKGTPCSLFRKMDGKEPFDIGLVKEAFSQCLAKSELDLSQYLKAYKELSSFFRLLGSAFSFVAQDVDDKIGILEKHSLSEHKEHYLTIAGLLDHEVSSGSADSGHSPADGALPSGARTLLRLHRALNFVVLFLGKLKDAPEDSSTSGYARECYEAALAQYHPWLVRKGALMAMYLLPNRRTLIASMCKTTLEEAVAVASDVVTSGKTIFEMTHKFYEDRGLLELA